VSIQDERALRDQLTSVLDDVEARPAPVGAAIKTGKAIRVRRRLAVAGGLAAIVIAGALVPGHLRLSAANPPADGRFQVSVHAPGKHDPASLIAFGTVNGRNWRAIATGPLRRLSVNFNGFPLLGGPLPKAPGATARTGITAFNGVGSGTGDHAEQALVSEVSPSITLITMRLANGAVLNLRPVTYDGTPIIALVLPEGLRVVDASAYSRKGAVAYAIPFYYRGQNTFYTWLRPSQAPTPVVSAALPVALDSGRRWTASVHIGPWGKCVVVLDHSGFNQGCGPISPTRKLADFDMGLGGGPVVGVTSPDVAFFEMTMADGSTVRVPVVHIGDTGYYAVASQTNPKVISWAAYDQGGHRLGGGPGIPGTPSSARH
jgi:hypothetical protein